MYLQKIHYNLITGGQQTDLVGSHHRQKNKITKLS